MEHVAAKGVEDHPRPIELAVELTGRPPGVPAEHPNSPDLVGHVDGITGQVDAAEVGEDAAPGVFPRPLHLGNGDQRVELHRPAVEDHSGWRHQVHPQAEAIYGRFGRRIVQDNSDGALSTVFHHVDDRAIEIRIVEGRRRQQQHTSGGSVHGIHGTILAFSFP